MFSLIQVYHKSCTRINLLLKIKISCCGCEAKKKKKLDLKKKNFISKF